jgi:membrane-associated phospholipid phosphatase
MPFPFLILVLVALLAGIVGAIVVSRDPLHAVASGGMPGFTARIASRAASRGEAFRTWVDACRHRTTAAGLAFCGMLVLFVGGWVVLALLAYLVRASSLLVGVDSSVAHWGNAHASALSDRLVAFATLPADTFVVSGLVILLVAGDWWFHRNGRVALFVLAVVLGDFLITLAVKDLVDRARPTFNPIASTLGPSFPSGHASIAAAFYATAALVLSRGRSRRVVALVGGLAVGLTAAVAMSRVLLEVHWISDVVAGVGLGWAWFALCVVGFGSLPRRERMTRVPAAAGISGSE